MNVLSWSSKYIPRLPLRNDVFQPRTASEAAEAEAVEAAKPDCSRLECLPGQNFPSF